MAEDMPGDEGPALDSGRAKRAPPTIDLEASEVSGETRKAGGDAQPERISEKHSFEEPSSREPPAAARDRPPSSSCRRHGCSRSPGPPACGRFARRS